MTTYTPNPATLIAGSTDSEDGTPTLYSVALQGDSQDVIADPGDYPYTLASGLSGINIVIANSTGAYTIDDQGNPAAFPSTRGQSDEVVVEYYTKDSDANVSASAGVRTITLTANSLPSYSAPAADEVNEGSTVNIDIASHVTDADGQTLSLASVSAANGTINSVTGTVINYTAPAFASFETDTITFDVSDGLETVEDQEYDIAVQESSGITVGDPAVSDGTASFTVTHGQANQPLMFYWFVVSRPSFVTADFIRFTGELNRVQARELSGQGVWRLQADDGPDSFSKDLFDGAGILYDETPGDKIVVLASVRPNGSGGSLVTISGKTPGEGWSTNTDNDATLVGTCAISGSDLILFGSVPCTIYRAGVAIGVEIDPTSTTVRDAIWNSGTDTEIEDPTTLQSLLSSGTILADMYGGAAVFNAATNAGGTLDLTGALTGTFTTGA